MSTLDTLVPIISSPWLDADGAPLPVRALPGLRPEVIETLERVHSRVLGSALKDLLSICCGFSDTALGHLDFTGCCYPEESCKVFNPCLTIAIDDAGRRWIAELNGDDLPGAVWCIFPVPAVAVYVSHDLAAFLSTLRECTNGGRICSWLLGLTDTARAVWAQRRKLALRPHMVPHSDGQVRAWLAGLPTHAYVYDLRVQTRARGFPYGVAGPSGRLYRCERLPLFAVVGSSMEGWRAGQPRIISPFNPVAQFAEVRQCA